MPERGPLFKWFGQVVPGFSVPARSNETGIVLEGQFLLRAWLKFRTQFCAVLHCRHNVPLRLYPIVEMKRAGGKSLLL